MTKEAPFFLCALVLMLLSGALLTTNYFFIAPAIPVAFIGLIILYRYPEYGVLLLAFLVPFEGLFTDGVLGGNKLFTGAKIIGFALISITGLKLLSGEIPFRNFKSPLWWPILLLVFAFSVSTAQSPYFSLSINSLRQLLTAIVIFFITLGIRERINIIHLMRVIVVSTAFTSLVSIISASNAVGGRAIGLLTDPNYFALLLTTAIPLAIYLFSNEKGTTLRLFWFVLFIFMLVAFQKTLSRSGMIVLAVTFVFLGFHYKEKLKMFSAANIGLTVIGCTLAAIITFNVIPQEYRERILSLANITSGVRAFEDRSLGRRASYVVVGLKTFKENPIIGIGPGTFPVEYGKSGYAVAFSLNGDDVAGELFRRGHNTYLESLTETGLIGFSALCGIVLMGLSHFKKARNRAISNSQFDRATLISHMGISFLAISLFMMFLTGLNNKYFWIFLALSSSFFQQSEQHVRSNANSNEPT